MKELFDKALAAIYKGDSSEFNEAVTELDGLNFKDSEGRTLLYHAVLRDDIEAVNILLEKGVEINDSDKNGWSPLHYSVNEHLISITEKLINHGAKLDLKDSYGNTVIWRAVFASKGRGEIIKLLLDSGADPSLANDSGVSALDLAKTIGNYDVLQFFE